MDNSEHIKSRQAVADYRAEPMRCDHARKGLRRAGSASWDKPAAIVCLSCGTDLVTIEEAKIFVAAADQGFAVQTMPAVAEPEKQP